jgi:hypothetical protein
METIRLTQEEFDKLREYSCSLPTATTIGKRWKRNINAFREGPPEWYLGEFVEDEDPEKVGINWYTILIGDEPEPVDYRILFRRDQDTEEEYEVAERIWGSLLTRFRSEIPEDATVIGRYSCLPFYKDLEEELESKGSRLVNTHKQHKYIADMEWYHDLGPSLTPQTWFGMGWKNVPDTEHGYVVKGKTNSRKFKWDTHMFAEDREALRAVLSRLYDDPLLGRPRLGNQRVRAS